MVLAKDIRRVLSRSESESPAPSAGSDHSLLHAEICSSLGRLPGRANGPDRIWSLWIKAPKSTRRAGYSYFLLDLVRYKDEDFFYLDKQSIGTFNRRSARFDREVFATHLHPLWAWLRESLPLRVQLYLDDPSGYASELEKEVDLGKRTGRILRKDLWAAGWPRWILAPEEIQSFLAALGEANSSAILPEMTLRLYLKYADACYRANYPQYSGLLPEDESLIYSPDDSPQAKYKKMADGRHAGLLELPMDSAPDFERWYAAGAQGGHPWEIFRGGNSTHVDLSPVKIRTGFQVLVEGINRFEEIARSVTALQARGLPFVLDKADSFKAMATGDDYVGVLPYWHAPRYAQAEFPKEDRIETFMNLPGDRKELNLIKRAIRWYPVP